MQKKMPLLMLVSCVMLLQGCATLNGNVPFKYTPSLSEGEPINLKIGVKKFIDHRPDSDRKSTKSISDIDDKVTAKVIEDLRSSQMFEKVSYPGQPESDDIVLSGEIKRFDWNLQTNPIQYIPFLNLLLFFGVPAGDLNGEAQLVVTLSDSAGNVLAVYDKNDKRKSTFNIYQGTTGEMGAELSDAFREIMKSIKAEIRQDADSGKLKKS